MKQIPTPLGDLTIDGWTLLGAALAVIATILVARYASRAAIRLGHRVEGIPDDLALQASRFVRYFVIVVGAGVVLSILGAPIEPLLVAAIILALALALMLRGIADNFGAGLIIQTRHPLRLGDLVESHGYRGHVRDLNSRSVVIETFDGHTVHLPNSSVMDEPLVNLSTRGRIRTDFQVRVLATDNPTGLVREVRAAAAAVDGVLPEPGPQALLSSIDEDRTTVLLRVWILPGDEALVAGRVVHAVHLCLGDAVSAVTWPVPPPPVVPPRSL